MTLLTKAFKSLVIGYDLATKQITEQFTAMTAREFMLTGGDGIYTGMRTVCHGRVFLLEDHLQRLSNSNAAVTHNRKQGVEYWRSVLVPLIRHGLDKCGRQDRDYKITVLANQHRVSLQFVDLHAPQFPGQPCWIKFNDGVKRDHPEVKDLQWVHDREYLERLVVLPINEIVMTDQGRFLEGLSSNFFAVQQIATDLVPAYLNYELVSAPIDKVLLGTVMKLVLRICECDRIQISFNPEIDSNRWSGVFVTSTSRLVLPISRIVFDQKGRWCDLDSASNPLISHLQESVVHMAKEQSIEV